MKLIYDISNGIGIEMQTEQKIKAICSVNSKELEDYELTRRKNLNNDNINNFNNNEDLLKLRRKLDDFNKSQGHSTFVDILTIFYIVLIIISIFALFFQLLSMIDNLKLFFFFADSLTLCILLVKLINRQNLVNKGIFEVEKRRNNVKFNDPNALSDLEDGEEEEEAEAASEKNIDEDLENAFLKARDLSDSFDINLSTSYESRLLRKKKKKKNNSKSYFQFLFNYWNKIYEKVSVHMIFFPFFL